MNLNQENKALREKKVKTNPSSGVRPAPHFPEDPVSKLILTYSSKSVFQFPKELQEFANFKPKKGKKRVLERSMGDPLVVATAKVLLEKILSLATDRIGLVFGFKNDVERLRRSIATIQSVLADAEKKQVQNEAVKLWLKRIEEVAYEADDVFDELNYELLRCRVKTSKNPVKDKVCFFFSSSRTLNFRCRMACKVRDINLKLKLINEDAIGFGLHSHVAIGSNKIFHSPNRETDSFLDQNVVGRENDASQIVQRLRNPSAETVSFIPISGMGGIGKTTLAQLVYNDAQIDQFFDKKIWICVCNYFQATRVLRLILASLKRKSVDIPRDAMVQEIKNELEGKRYLLVLDDVWEDSSTYREWHDFLRSLLGISTVKGNWGLVATRQLGLASVVTNKELTIDLKGLPGDDCWQILNRKAFPRGEVPEELNEMKEEIIKACQGVPLVASVIGGLLSINTKEVWLSVIRDEIRNVSGSVMEILRLSFDHLPSASIKKCFAYCSLFRKSSDMKKDMLIQLWMAEGFLQPNYGNEIEMEMEAIGLRYFDILVKSSLFQEVTDKLGCKYGRMHDLVHDLARIVSESETVNLGQGLRYDIPGIRYLVLDSLQESTKKVLKERSCSLRTIFVECDIRNDFLLNFKGVRVLNSATGLECIHFRNSISKLIHLRYLHLSVPSDVEALPESLCKLYNLQTLRIYGHVITKLPEGMSNLISLRHLHCDFSTEDLWMPLRMGDLRCLRTLEFFNIGREKGRQIEEIGFLMNIRDGLQIRNLELVNSKEEAQRAKLFAKSKLTNLSLNWEEHREGDNIDENVLEGLQPHPNLQKLVVKNFMGLQFPSWIMKMGHNNLESLELNNCKRCEEIPKLGQLPLLKFLKLYELDNIRCIGFSFYGVDDCSSTDPPRQVPKKLFPALKMLKLYNLPNLVDWVGAETLLANGDTQLAAGDSIEAFPNLEELSISDCPQLVTAPNHFQCLKKLEMSKTGGNTGLLVSSMCNKVTTLTELRIEYAQVLTCVPDAILSSNQNLVNLTLVGCSNLTHVESGSFSACKNLRQLHISRCSNLKSVSAPNGQQQHLPSTLRSLRIFYCSKLISLPGELIQSCVSLEALEVFSCQKLVSFPIDLEQTLSLLRLDLHDCPQLITMPKGFSNCNKLREIAIGPFSDSVEFNWSALSSLSIHTLKLYGWPHSVGLPDQLQSLVQIKDLLLCKFGSIESLPDWLEKCVSLEQLSLWNCHKLKYLPSKEATSRLTNLHQLLVYRCPILAERCSPSKGPDSEWSKISHVSMIIIDGKPIKGSG